MNKKFIIIAAIVIALAGGIALAMNSSDSKNTTDTTKNMDSHQNGDNPDKSSTKPAEPNTISIDNLEYTVEKLTVKKGTAVTWRNDDTAQHDVIFDDSTMSEANSPNLLKKGETHQYTFNQVGTFSYHCTPHAFMKAQIEVTE